MVSWDGGGRGLPFEDKNAAYADDYWRAFAQDSGEPTFEYTLLHIEQSSTLTADAVAMHFHFGGSYSLCVKHTGNFKLIVRIIEDRAIL